MAILIVEAQVPPEKWEAIEKAFKAGMDSLKLFPIAESFLIQSKSEPKQWKIVSVWYRLEDLVEVQSKGPTPGELMFTLIGAKPIISAFDVIAHAIKALEDPRLNKSRFSE